MARIVKPEMRMRSMTEPDMIEAVVAANSVNAAAEDAGGVVRQVRTHGGGPGQGVRACVRYGEAGREGVVDEPADEIEERHEEGEGDEVLDAGRQGVLGARRAHLVGEEACVDRDHERGAPPVECFRIDGGSHLRAASSASTFVWSSAISILLTPLVVVFFPWPPFLPGISSLGPWQDRRRNCPAINHSETMQKISARETVSCCDAA